MLPKYYQPKKLKWTRYLGHFGYDPLNNCSKFSFDYSMTCQLKLQMMSLPKTRKCRVKMQSQNIIDTCAKSNNAYICRLYRFPVRYDGKLYSNPHCALCNGININATQYIGMFYTTFTEKFMLKSNFQHFTESRFTSVPNCEISFLPNYCIFLVFTSCKNFLVFHS